MHMRKQCDIFHITSNSSNTFLSCTTEQNGAEFKHQIPFNKVVHCIIKIRLKKILCYNVNDETLKIIQERKESDKMSQGVIYWTV